ncbi:hypothetical protein [Cryptosporangium sp. NPDC051539]|uniref:hypothetical protein n=1 Tax=Cryptosporangium sp. NPDC051539 TaxID=3363962 RepID=UPI0037972BF7
MHALPVPVRPPAAVLVTLLAGVYAGYFGYLVTAGFLHHDLLVIGPVLELGVWGLLLTGLWNGNNLAYVLVTVAATLTVAGAFPALSDLDDWHDAVWPVARTVFGLAVLVALLYPRSVRAYYARRR